MWLPKNEGEILAAVQSGALEETTIFDAKKELPSKNLEIAKDIAAMTNDGGVIIYGIGEDEHRRLTIPSPIPLKGQAERIDAIVRTLIAEPPVIRIFSKPSSENSSLGYVIVFVPPSERAPHMVVVKGDHRYYGRSATGNVILPEGEVARLYARRQQMEIDLTRLLDSEIQSSPYEPNENFAFLFLVARPVFAREGFFDSAIHDRNNLQTILSNFVLEVSSGAIFPHLYEPDFYPPPFWKQLPEGLLGQLHSSSSKNPDAPKETLNLKIDYDGCGHLFCGRASDKIHGEGTLYVFSELIAGLTSRFVAFIAKLYEKTGYIGMLDLGIAIIGLKGSIVYTNNRNREYGRIPYDRDKYTKTRRFSALQLLDEPQNAAQYLVMPLINALSQNRIDPFRHK
jgi:hypothetical protein